ncbi:acyl-CoA carboxylase subunit epsilon [Corynebacterium sp. 320]|uniref:Acyl-CoA carboxylase subunit epsilon n=1 Tax=Corynebacterium zhongnanshanii TaxID=2768834 RepID=A0ABQ6VGN3_9CORY|nr:MULTISPECIES: acyl-CoA carboxylase epsilon subunit [Corynebacterium]KAB1504198.1 acyl-CoA carboxylase subunit epsilon [Corynebacterium sp. 320]KAB1552702.1 acyl-CoA carboxylase subunit epsilon [Corynebacterium sp. 321]KAB1554080.1 acyl-CoA carboxylase subunit epsilon [Corynebacterium sp. 319]KAB3522948.1 acyl-CoA carboxylase subunit epsilon [Corynebacterium zhongnanshanii]KAB3528334.1 acyl-CoA carboxylase subunit epsilon [Corynebacterium sp. 250]
MGKYTIVKGELDPTEHHALETVLDAMAQEAEAARTAKPDTRGLWGATGLTDNPLGFRNPPLPRR